MENSKSNLDAMRHSCEHLLHVAIEKYFEGSKKAMGPAIEDGFYHDFDYSGKVTEEDLPKLEEIMQGMIAKKLKITKKEITITEARELFKENKYKLEWVDMIEKKMLVPTVYIIGDESNPVDVDLCKGPHVQNTGDIGPFKLLSIAGAYWHGDEKNKMLTRIYGTCFPTQTELDEYLQQKVDLKEKDHRKLGKDLDLFVFSDVVGKGLPLWTPRGSTIRRELERFIVDEEIRRGYLHVYTPDIARIQLYEKSGHYPYYKESMYAPIDDGDEKFMLRPMTCPHHFELYLSKPHSYRDLPMRIAELAQLYRYEKSGELTGLLRVRTFCLADAHIVAKPEQSKQEINAVLDLIGFVCKTLGLEYGKNYFYRLSLGDRKDTKKYYKDDKAWDNAEEVLRSVLIERGDKFVEAEGEAAFYGPKIDIEMLNLAGKDETAFTVQYDFVMPKRFKLSYTDEDGKEKEAIVIHRSSIGCIERIMAFLIEHYAGAFPAWLCPEQVAIIPISDQNIPYAEKIKVLIDKAGLRSYIDGDAERMQNKIRKAQEMKVPYMFIVGKKEEDKNVVSLRLRTGHEYKDKDVNDTINSIAENVAKKEININDLSCIV